MTNKCAGLMGIIFGHNFRNDTVAVIMGENDLYFIRNHFDFPDSLGKLNSGKVIFEFGKKRCQRCGEIKGEEK